MSDQPAGEAAESFSVSRDEASAAFFDGTGGGVLMIRNCSVCHLYLAPHITTCQQGHELQWVRSKGIGSLVSWAIDHGPAIDPRLADPQSGHSVFGIVQLEEGPWMQVPLLEANEASLRTGARWRVAFVRLGEGEHIVVFVPAVVNCRPDGLANSAG